MLTTLTPPTEGTARVAGHDVRKDADGVRNSIGVIPQALTSDPELTAEENLLIHAKLYGVPANRRTQLIRDLLEAVDLTRFAKGLVGTFSGGMRRRLEIARGLVHSPKILFLDEPTTGLDPVSRTNVWEMIDKVQKQSNLTILLTTHYMDEAERLCDRVGVVDKGKMIALGTPAELIASLGGQQVVELASDRALDDAGLETVRGVRAARKVADAWALTVDEVHVSIPALLDHLEKLGAPLTRLSTHHATLEDVFVSLTGRQLRE